jgi:hypothetical protein
MIESATNRACWSTSIRGPTCCPCVDSRWASVTRGRDSTVRTFVTHSDAELDPIVALGLMLLEGRPDKMGILGELFRR